jgi:hypothetical protein
MAGSRAERRAEAGVLEMRGGCERCAAALEMAGAAAICSFE